MFISIEQYADGDIHDIKLTTRTKSGSLIRVPAQIQIVKNRIEFIKSPFSLKNELKAMKGSRWEGYDEENPRKIWSVEDCQRNRFQLAWLMGQDVYDWFDREVVKHDYSGLVHKRLGPTDAMPHQAEMTDAWLTYHYQIWAAEMGTGKTLAAQMGIERSGVNHWWWVGPKTSLPNMKLEFEAWGFDFDKITIEFMTYDALTTRMDEWKTGDFVPQGVVFDESSRVKGDTSQRSRGAQLLADEIRKKYQFEGFVLEMSGTPSPKSPLDWWSQTEIAWPGFLKEGSKKALEQRLAFIVQKEYDSGVFPKRIGWKDDEHKCDVCGQLEAEGPHTLDGDTEPDEYHEFVPSANEVAYMYERLKGLVIIKHAKDCLNLPDKRYRRVICKPSSSVLRVAGALSQAAPNTITGLTWLRELSDGFQYKEIKDGESSCRHCPEACGKVDEWYLPDNEDKKYTAIDMLDHELVAKLLKREVECPQCKGTGKVPKMIRISNEVPCPKDLAWVRDLERCEENGRIVGFAGFTGSIDRMVKLTRSEGWCVVRCDGGGWEVSDHKGEIITRNGEEALRYWSDMSKNARVAFIAHPESGGMSLTLTESRMSVFWSNSFKTEFRAQAEARIHRLGQTRGVEIVDYCHLPSDHKVLDTLLDDRRLELLTLGEVMESSISVGNFSIEELAA
jgi:hypothetical protein